ncbi:amino acid adenylation domain-containing protein [Mucilaginibacter achroorhodeus]|uniref:Amino acid adenylation domain-containing protein n=1 Tax=Mucilaginibacter achroorhodeus TaxID=2599294 RepID=A0A563U758_9SPHI|nr:polyketide synthase [Mucilaginibacter achroorhodeus]TWR27178.1 amino acid adenylation domain-containing protein [Mucilaginibacter achroorhodeus]
MSILTDNIYFGEPGNEVLIHHVFEQRVTEHPELIAVQFGNDSITYAELNGRADKLARVISATSPEASVIGISATRSVTTIISLFAILKAGKAYLPLDPSFPADRLEDIIADCGMDTCLSPASDAEVFRQIVKNVLVSDEPLPAVHQPEKVAKNKVAYIIYTSGSTGKPKGVCVGHAGVVNLIKWHYKISPYLSAGHKMLQFSPLIFDASVMEIFCTLSVGGTLVLVDEATRIDPTRLLRYINDQQINRINVPFVALQYLTEAADAEQYFPASLQEVISAGEQLKITPQVLSFFKALPNCVFYNMYGPTEASVCTTGLKLDGPAESWPLLPNIGKPLDNVSVHILNDELKEVPQGEQGELCISGICLAYGYLNRPDLTAEKFVDWTDANGKIFKIYRSGDLGFYLPDGNIEYLGRKDTQVKIRGNRVELGEIEVVLNQLPGIQQAVVVAREDVPGQKRLVAYLIASGNKNEISFLRENIEQKLPDYMMPAAFVWVDDFIKTTSGKIDRNRLPAPDMQRPELSVLYKAPSNNVEKNIAGYWADLLQLDKVGVYDNFFELGGNSILALKTVAALKKQFGYTLPITKLYQYPTVNGIASYIDGNKNVAKVTAVKSKRDKSNNDVAVIGMAVRFPGANTIYDLWNLLTEGRETTSFFTDDELDASIPQHIRNAANYVKARGIVENAQSFDAAFFGINPKVAELMDPQQRVFLELAWEALETSGHLPGKYDGPVGVFAGVGNNTYYTNNVLSNTDKIENIGRFLTATINEKDYIATRTAYELNLTGPAVSVHAACSTSLLAIAQAADSIRNGQCNVALAGGSSISAPIKSGHLYQQGTMLSADGHCRPFDAESDGTVFSDGAGVVVLKSLQEAERDGDRVYAVLKGVGVNNDGGGKGSFTAPSAAGQAGAIAMAIADAEVKPADISYVEAHGTATALGDPIEIEGLNLAFGKQEKNQYCAIGSIKSNMGHLVAAAGVAGFIKTTLALFYKQLPASLYFTKPNPNIDFSDSPFFVNTQLREWETNGKRIAGVSSFGVGGTNVHVILEEYDNEVRSSGESRPLQLISWSAKTATSASKFADRLYHYVKNNPEAPLADIAYTLHTTRNNFKERNFILAADNDDLLEKLTNFKLDITNSKVISQSATEVVFMFPGQGAQYLNMGRELYVGEPVFADAVNECVALLQGTGQADIADVIYAPGSPEATEKLKNTFYTQPAIFITSYAMAKLWMSWGVEPTIFVGHSIGEFVAAHFAGVFSLADALKLITERARLVSEAPEGDMLSVRLTAQELEAILPQDLSVAAINSKKLTVVAGKKEAVAAFAKVLDERGTSGRLLQTSHAFHSAMMDDIVKPFEQIVRSVKINSLVKPIMSTVTGNWLTEAEACDPAYWADHLRKTVRFANAIEKLAEDKGRVYLEVGPGRTLATLAAQQTADKPVVTIGGMDNSNNQSEYQSVLKAVGQLWLNGIEPNWNEFYIGQRKRLRLPAYAFDRKIYWVEPATINPAGMVNYQPEEIVPDTPPAKIEEDTTPSMITRKDFLAEKLQGIFTDAAGIDIDNASADVSFPEIGFDSLLLTQIATNLKKTFNVNITFRKLFEDYNSINLLADFLDKTLPTDQFGPPASAKKAAAAPQSQPVYAQAATPQPVAFYPQAATAPVTGAGSEMALNMISQQLQLLATQIAHLQGGEVKTKTVTLQPPPLANELKGEPVAPPVLEPEPEVTAEEMVEIKKPFGATARIERKVQELDEKQLQWLEDLTKRYNDKTRKSKEQTQEHRAYMADPRVVSGFRPLTKELVYPVVINRSKGNRLWDVDGNEYIDALNGFGSNMLGYQPDVLKKAIIEQIDKGYEIGPQHELAGPVCKLLCEFTGHDRAALCNTGSEAVLGAMRVARTVTGRSLIVAFSGSYHGIMDEVIVRGTKKLKTFPAASGILMDNVQNMLILDYGTDEALRIIKERADEIAAVLVEPVQSRRPDFQPIEFLKQLRTLTADEDICLVFDEVISGFRFHPGGTQAIFGIKADLGTYGKVIGGGMPVGAICGKKEYMDALDGGFWDFGDSSVPEVGVTYFAGTFVRHPLALAATKASLEYMKEQGPSLQEKLTAMATRLRDGFAKVCSDANIPVTTVGYGSLWRIKFLEDVPYNELLFTLMRLRGVHILDGFPCFMTDAHTEQDVDFMIEQFRQSIHEMVDVGFFKFTSAENHVQLVANGTVNTNGTASNVNLEAMNTPPVEGAKLGRDNEGNPAWFVKDEADPTKYVQYNINNN